VQIIGGLAAWLVPTSRARMRLSKRQQVLCEYEKALEKRLKDRQLRDVVGLEDDAQDYIDDAIVEDQYKELSSKRFTSLTETASNWCVI
jgi:hypothetical protein